MATPSLETRIEDLVRDDPRYCAEAYHFVYDALDYAVQLTCFGGGDPMETARHIGVDELLEGIRQLALEEFGPLARCVFESWGVYSTDDFGEIVFNLIARDLLHQSDTDRKEDFQGRFSFHEALDDAYRPVVRLEDC